MRVLYNAWPLVKRPNSPAALHLLSLFEQELPGIEKIAVLPGEPLFPLPKDVVIRVERADDTTGARLAWEQNRLLRVARQERAGAIHVVGEAPPLFGREPVLFSPTNSGMGEAAPAVPPGWMERLRGALSEGGLARVRAWLWAADLPAPAASPSRVDLPPSVHPAFMSQPSAPATLSGMDVPEAVVIYHGNGSMESLQEALAAWTWAAGPVGQSSPLWLVGLSELERQAADDWQAQYDLPAGTVVTAPPLDVAVLAAVYRGCAAVLHPQAVSPWDGSARLALASGVPLVAYENPYSDAMAGSAAYLVPETLGVAERRRRLGAALITVIVEENVAGRLAQAARERSAGWHNDFSLQLTALYLSFEARAGR